MSNKTLYLLALASAAIGAVMGTAYVNELFDMTDFVGFGRGFIPMIKQDMDILDQLIQKEKEDKQDE